MKLTALSACVATCVLGCSVFVFGADVQNVPKPQAAVPSVSASTFQQRTIIKKPTDTTVVQNKLDASKADICGPLHTDSTDYHSSQEVMAQTGCKDIAAGKFAKACIPLNHNLWTHDKEDTHKAKSLQACAPPFRPFKITPTSYQCGINSAYNSSNTGWGPSDMQTLQLKCLPNYVGTFYQFAGNKNLYYPISYGGPDLEFYIYICTAASEATAAPVCVWGATPHACPNGFEGLLGKATCCVLE